ncbi:hypothetical protein P261_00143 [Lachnospiraceae bacterium TWA4]|nr:hypothetical protein P261_00143 [Lachnospiraceae bacterium TWA4]
MRNSQEGIEIIGCNKDTVEKLSISAKKYEEIDLAEALIEVHGNIDLYGKCYLVKIKDLLKEKIKYLKQDLLNNLPLFSSQLQCFYPSSVALFTGDNNSINGRLNTMRQMGIVEKTTDNDSRWRLSGIVLEDLIKEGQKVDNLCDFEVVFQTAIDFYSKYFVLGECGTYLLDRLDPYGDQYHSPFRFKHEYFMQALNDFNLIDLLELIEQDNWCEIKYRHGTANFLTTLLCKPLQIKISVRDGRQFLVFYNPIKRSCTNLRLEFIEEIISYDKKQVYKALSEGCNLSQSDIKSDLRNIKQSLKYAWGVSFSDKQEKNVALPVIPKYVEFSISYDEDREYYIKNRMFREARNRKIKKRKGNLCFYSQISDSKEMRPWIRSFYSRIIDSKGLEDKDFSLLSDIEKCIKGMKGLKKQETLPPNRWKSEEVTISQLKGGEKVRTHEYLFNELFCIYYHMISEVILSGCSSYKDEFVSKEAMNQLIKDIQERYALKKGIKTDKLLVKEIEWLIKMNAFGKEQIISGKSQIRFKYQCDLNIELYRNILPLTVLEVRWLKTILTDSKMRYFLSNKQIQAIALMLEEKYPQIKKLPMESIVYYDRYQINEQIRETEKEFVSLISGAIYNGFLVELSYETRYGNEISGKFKPLIIEFSKRNNRFQACLQSCENGHFYQMNLSQINSMTECKEGFDYAKALKQYKQYRQSNELSVKIEFYDVRNIADRLLTEFSPWKKYCTYNSDTEIYTLEIFYQKSDEVDLIIRLMGYGGDIHLIDSEHPISKEILSRFTKQRELLLERQKNKGGER